ncbi:MAG TPA: hypothetical protein VI076_09085 [Actinopolymorphaceae bacterium]
MTQRVSVQPGSTVELSAWFRTSPAVERVFLGAAWNGGEKLDTFDGGVPDEYTRRTATIDVPDDVHEVTILVGYGADGGDAILQVDDVELTKK